MSLAISFKSLAVSAFMLVPEDGENLSEKTQEAYLLYRSGNIEQAVEAFKGQAQAGDEAAIFALGALLQEGQGAGKIPGTAEQYFRLAADKDYAPAQFNLGKLLTSDPERLNEGVAWMKKAAEGGSKKGLLFCAVSSLDGTNGFERDPVAAYGWLTRGDEAGMTEAKLYLGRMYQAGYGVTKDIDKAREYVIEAAELGVQDAMLYLAGAYLSGDLGEKAPEKAIELYKKGAGSEDGRVFQLALGNLYEQGTAVEKDYEKALFWYGQAVGNGDSGAYNKLGFFHERGMGVPADEEKALGYYKLGAEAGVPVSMYNVAQMLTAGKGVEEPDEREALKYLHRAASAGMALAQFELADHYLTGEVLMADPIAAAAWLERAATTGLPDAQLRLAEMYDAGQGLQRSIPKAARWYQMASVAGKPEAMFRLGQLYEDGVGTKPNPVKAMGYYLGAAAAGYAAAAERRDAVSRLLTEERRAEAQAFLDAGFRVPSAEGTAGAVGE